MGEGIFCILFGGTGFVLSIQAIVSMIRGGYDGFGLAFAWSIATAFGILLMVIGIVSIVRNFAM